MASTFAYTLMKLQNASLLKIFFSQFRYYSFFNIFSAVIVICSTPVASRNSMQTHARISALATFCQPWAIPSVMWRCNQNDASRALGYYLLYCVDIPMTRLMYLFAPTAEFSAKSASAVFSLPVCLVLEHDMYEDSLLSSNCQDCLCPFSPLLLDKPAYAS